MKTEMNEKSRKNQGGVLKKMTHFSAANCPREAYLVSYKNIILALILYQASMTKVNTNRDMCNFVDTLDWLQSSLFLYPRHLCRRVYSFRLSGQFVRSYVRSFVTFASKFCIKVSQAVYISATTYQKAFIF